MAALRKPPSKTLEKQQQQPLPLKSILKRARSPTPSEDDDEDDGGESPQKWKHDSKRTSYYHPSVPSSSSPPVSMTKQDLYRSKPPSRLYSKNSKSKRRALLQESSVEDFSSQPTIPKHAHFAVAACKFAKAGCPFRGSPEEVKSHEDTYCSPMYQQLAHYKMLAARSSTHPSPHATTSKLPPVHHYAPTDFQGNSNMRSSSVSNFSSSQDASAEVEALNAQILRLQSDLRRAQSQLEEEKNLRTERLRKASERCLELMSLSELGEGKVEVLRMKLKAERDMREKLEEEVESLRAAETAQQQSLRH